jgi:pyruvate/2-oxoglutarate/acetoin dehydrogenase E1 component
VALGPASRVGIGRAHGRLLVVHEAVQVAGFGAEVAAAAAEATGCRVARLGAPRIPVGYAPVLEAASRISPAMIAEAARAMLTGKPARAPK